MIELGDILAKSVLTLGIKEALTALAKKIKKASYNKDEKKAMIEAITSIQFATIKSRNFIREKGYKPNEGLTQLWHKALEKVVAANIEENLPDYLYEKAKFWGNPQDWIDHPETLKLVPKLNSLDEKCEMLLLSLK